MMRKLVWLVLGTAVLLSCSACATAANRRLLYSDTPPRGPWTDYAKRQELQVTTTTTTTTTTTVR